MTPIEKNISTLLKLVDTNVLLDYPNIVTQDSIVISYEVLRELNKLKMSEREIAQKAQKALKKISTYRTEIAFNLGKKDKNMDTDLFLVKLAKEKGMSLITNDVYIHVMCEAEKVKCEKYEEHFHISGIKYLLTTIDDDNIQKIYSGELLDGLLSGDYICIKDKNSPFVRTNGETDFETKAILKYSGDQYVSVRPKTIQCFEENIKPLNSEQICLIDALNNKKKTIIYAGGTFGTGKSKLTISYAVEQLSKGSINKIVYVPNNSINNNSRDPGTLPGTLYEKEIAFMGTIMDIVPDYIIEEWYGERQLEIMPISLARGRNIDDSIIIVSEAQNLTDEHIKLLLGRCGKNTRIFFDGDFKQADGEIFKRNSGLKSLLQLKNSPIYREIFCGINLITTERSLTAQAASFLDNLV